MKIIEVKNFSFRYANGDRDSLENVTLDVEEGTFNVLCGKSGCGKSSLFGALSGLAAGAIEGALTRVLDVTLGGGMLRLMLENFLAVALVEEACKRMKQYVFCD